MKTHRIAGRYFSVSSFIACSTCFLFISGSTQAATLTIGMQPVGGGAYQGWTLDSSKNGTYVEDQANPNGVYGPDATVDEWKGTSSNGAMTLSYDIYFDADPVVTSFFSLQNTS